MLLLSPIKSNQACFHFSTAFPFKHVQFFFFFSFLIKSESVTTLDAFLDEMQH